EPCGCDEPLRHFRDIRLGKAAAERLDDHVGHRRTRERLGPATNRDVHCALHRELTRDAGSDPRERREIVLPERHIERVLGCELACESPGDARIAIVVDDAAEDVPACTSGHDVRERRGCDHYGAACGVSGHNESRRHRMNATVSETLTIDVISDVVCPWCYI